MTLTRDYEMGILAADFLQKMVELLGPSFADEMREAIRSATIQAAAGTAGSEACLCSMPHSLLTFQSHVP